MTSKPSGFTVVESLIFIALISIVVVLGSQLILQYLDGIKSVEARMNVADAKAFIVRSFDCEQTFSSSIDKDKCDGSAETIILKNKLGEPIGIPTTHGNQLSEDLTAQGRCTRSGSNIVVEVNSISGGNTRPMFEDPFLICQSQVQVSCGSWTGAGYRWMPMIPMTSLGGGRNRPSCRAACRNWMINNEIFGDYTCNRHFNGDCYVPMAGHISVRKNTAPWHDCDGCQTLFCIGS